MLYLKNSLVNLTIALFSLFFLTTLSAEESNFIFPKKKIITIKTSEKKQNNFETRKNFFSSDLPQKKPFKEKLSTQQNLKDNIKTSGITKKKETKSKIIFTKPPEKKPVPKNNIIIKKVDKPYLESESQNIINQIKEKTKKKITKKVLKTNNVFLYPSKKPL